MAFVNGIGLHPTRGVAFDDVIEPFLDASRRDSSMNKNKNIFEKMGGYVGFLPPPTYFLHIRCDQ